MNLLRVVESTPGLYYSYETDITLKYVQAVLLPLLFISLVLPMLLVSRNLSILTSLQRRCNLAKGWMSKPVWKQVCLLADAVFELFHNIEFVECYDITASNWHVNTYSLKFWKLVAIWHYGLIFTSQIDVHVGQILQRHIELLCPIVCFPMKTPPVT